MSYLWSFIVDSQPSQQNTSESCVELRVCDNLMAAIAGTMRLPPFVPRRVTRVSNMQAWPPCVRLGVTREWLTNGNQLPVSSCQDTLGCLHRQLGVSRSSLTSSAGRRTSNTPLMADKHIGTGQTGHQMGTFRLKTATTTKTHSVCFSGLPFETQASYFHEMLRGNRFWFMGKQ